MGRLASATQVVDVLSSQKSEISFSVVMVDEKTRNKNKSIKSKMTKFCVLMNIYGFNTQIIRIKYRILL